MAQEQWPRNNGPGTGNRGNTVLLACFSRYKVKKMEVETSERPWYCHVWLDSSVVVNWKPVPKMSLREQFDAKTPDQQLEICLAAITTRRLRGRLWYPQVRYWEEVATFLLTSEIWKVRWQDDKQALFEEVKSRSIGQSIITEDYPEKEKEYLIFNYTRTRENQKWVENSVTLLVNWGTTRELLLRSQQDLHLRIGFSEGCIKRRWLPAYDKVFASLAKLSSKSSNCHDLWSEIVQKALSQRLPEGMHTSQRRRGGNLTDSQMMPELLLSKDIYVHPKHVEEIMRKYDALDSYPALDTESNSLGATSRGVNSASRNAAPVPSTAKRSASTEKSTTNPENPPKRNTSSSQSKDAKSPLDDLPSIQATITETSLNILDAIAEIQHKTDSNDGDGKPITNLSEICAENDEYYNNLQNELWGLLVEEVNKLGRPTGDGTDLSRVPPMMRDFMERVAGVLMENAEAKRQSFEKIHPCLFSAWISEQAMKSQSSEPVMKSESSEPVMKKRRRV